MVCRLSENNFDNTKSKDENSDNSQKIRKTLVLTRDRYGAKINKRRI